ncbi:Gfo/Idh/MocA family protein [Paenibacillus thermotolerans]|uniref:Gfo/Idh/MocA family protein n=1 Tax=Paenibacillus thermotolerans TaxID=3027807 RepID=UPI002367780F|nr:MULTISPECIES: Gfo/Idh/MocA family oxidoreductase [unclassified Paenibacillus]
MDQKLKLGLIGLDTSHVVAFTKLLNDPEDPYHVAGGTIVAGYPGGSADLEASYQRVDGFTSELKDQYGVKIMDAPEEVAQACDALFITSVDGRVHYDLLKKVAPFGKPVFVDKPFTVRSDEAAYMFALAEQYRFPLMSCSALRYSVALEECLQEMAGEHIIGADTYGPMSLERTHPALYWYGIHSVEMLVAIMGKNCRQVTAFANTDHELVVGEWENGRIGTVRGNRLGNQTFGGAIHSRKLTKHVDVYSRSKPYYASMLERIMHMFASGRSPIDREETLAIIRFIEAANESRESGKAVLL